ncbi:MAG: hypothetical protein WBH44_08490 [Proteocatella sp.]
MKKIIRILVLTMFISVAFGAMCFAAPGNSVSVESVQKLSESFSSENGIINKPKDFVLATIDDNVMISGVGKEGDRVSIYLYTRSDEEYVLMEDSLDFSVGLTGFFAKEISLKYQTSGLPKESKLSKDTLIVLQLKRGEAVNKDYRIIKTTDEKDLEESLSTLRSTGFSTYSAASVTKP